VVLARKAQGLPFRARTVPLTPSFTVRSHRACDLAFSLPQRPPPMFPLLTLLLLPAADAQPADLIVHNAKIVTLDARSSTASAVRAGKIVAVGDDKAVLAHKGDKTRVIDAKGQTVLPGLVDSHVHPYSMVSTELADPPPLIRSLKDAFAHIKKQAAVLKKGEW